MILFLNGRLVREDQARGRFWTGAFSAATVCSRRCAWPTASCFAGPLQDRSTPTAMAKPPDAGQAPGALSTSHRAWRTPGITNRKQRIRLMMVCLPDLVGEIHRQRRQEDGQDDQDNSAQSIGLLSAGSVATLPPSASQKIRPQSHEAPLTHRELTFPNSAHRTLFTPRARQLGASASGPPRPARGPR